MLFKIFSVIGLVALLGCLLCLAAVMALGESQTSKGSQVQGGTESEKFYGFMNSVTWVPQQIWGGFVLVIQGVFLVLVILGVYSLNFITSHAVLSVMAASLPCIAGIALVVWREWEREFDLFPGDPPPTTRSWVLGLLVIVLVVWLLPWLFGPHPYVKYIFLDGPMPQ